MLYKQIILIFCFSIFLCFTTFGNKKLPIKIPTNYGKNYFFSNEVQFVDHHYNFLEFYIKSKKTLKKIGSLDLIPNKFGVIILKNVSKTNVIRFSATFLNNQNRHDVKFANYFKGECLNIDHLNAGASCKLEYSIPKTINQKPIHLDPSYLLKVTGNNIAKSSSLRINIPYAYISYLSPKSIYRCFIQSNGKFVMCNDVLNWKSRDQFDGFIDFKFQRHKNKIKVYLNGIENIVYVCHFDHNTGQIKLCHKAINKENVSGFAFSHDGTNVYLGRKEYRNLPASTRVVIDKCKVNKETGVFFNCKNGAAKTFNSKGYSYPLNIVLDYSNNNLYYTYRFLHDSEMKIFADFFKLHICKISPSSADLFNCHNVLIKSKQNKNPIDIAFITKKKCLVSLLNKKILICDVGSTNGVLANCTGALGYIFPTNICLNNMQNNVYFLSTANTITSCKISDPPHYSENKVLSSCKTDNVNKHRRTKIAFLPN